MDISINSPVQISINVVEYEEHVPSIFIHVDLIANKLGRSISVTTSCWVDCAVFDAFVGSLRSTERAVITDLSGELSLKVDAEARILVWSYTSSDNSGNAMRAGGEELLVEGDEHRILSAFENFPKWW